MTYDVLVVGAGLAGLECARRLVAAGRDVLVVDKARGVGGRLATRRGEGVSFDHGAQYFTARDPQFLASVMEWTHAGVVAPWEATLMAFDGQQWSVSGRETRHVGVPGMNAICKHLAATLAVRCDWRVAGLERMEDGWLARDAGGALIAARQVVLTAPPAQAAALLEPLPSLRDIASPVVMAPCWAVMLQLADRLAVPFDGGFINAGPLRWVARNNSKPGRPSAEGWVLHASSEWSSEHVGFAADEVARLLVEAFARCVPDADVTAHARSAVAHRWLYSQAEVPLQQGCVWSAADALGLAGDWLNGSRVEGAWRSGADLATRMLSAD